MANDNIILRNIEGIQKGQSFVYHFGLLAKDRRGKSDIEAIAKAAWDMYERRRVILIQRKKGDGYYAYIIIGR